MDLAVQHQFTERGETALTRSERTPPAVLPPERTNEKALDRTTVAAAAVTLAFFLDVMGSTSVFAAAPAIQHSIGLDQVGLQWTFTAATLPAGALLLVGGRMTDLFGGRRVFRLGLLLFAVASAGCGAADVVWLLVAARVVQGAAGALLIPAALSLLLGLYPGERQRRRALATWSAVGGAGATCGLLYGGVVTAALGWSWVFWFNVPAVMAIFGLTVALPHRVPVSGARRIDVPGVVTSSFGVAAVIYGITRAPQHGWADPVGVALLGSGAVLVGSFAVIERHVAHPMLPAALIRRRSVLRGNAVLLTAGIAVDGLLFLLTLYLQDLRGLSAVQYALISTIMTASSIAAAYIADRAIGRFGVRVVAAVGLISLLAACLLFIAVVLREVPAIGVSAGMLLFGLGMGAAYTAGSIQSLDGVPEHDTGIASGLQNISFTLGSTLGVAILSTAAESATVASHRSAGTSGLAVGFVAAAGIVGVGLSATSWPQRRAMQRAADDPV